jgi:ATP-dependent RNA helicase SUPV3L1/SUV3
MLLCGFEKFDKFFVRIDILERLFMQIINSGSDENKEIKLIPEMLNLLGCSKDNFKKLIKEMNYKVTEKKEDIFFKYSPKKKFIKHSDKKTKKESPFGILKNLNLN